MGKFYSVYGLISAALFLAFRLYTLIHALYSSNSKRWPLSLYYVCDLIYKFSVDTIETNHVVIKFAIDPCAFDSWIV